MAALVKLTGPVLKKLYEAEQNLPLPLRMRCALKILQVLGLNQNEIKRAVGLLHAFALGQMRPWEKARGLVREFVRGQEILIEMEKIQVAHDYIKSKIGNRKPEIVLALGSGLGGLADRITDAVIIPYEEIPCFPRVAGHVQGHKGNLVIGTLEGRTVAAMQGRFHLYQGVTAQEAVRPLRALAVLGAVQFFVTNAAGSLKPDKLKVGDLMLITDAYNRTGQNPLVGPNLDRLGTRFPDMSRAFSPGLALGISFLASRELKLRLKQGNYVQVLGPNYEWHPETRILQGLKELDAVGMSTAIEVLAAKHAGMTVIGVTLITNIASGLAEGAIEHGHVEEEGEKASIRFQGLMRLLIRRAAELKSGTLVTN